MDSKFSLKVVWLENKLGIAVDQLIGKGISPLTVYFFWGVNASADSIQGDAWECLKIELDAKHWIPEEERNQILNQATDVINYWQDLRNNSRSATISEAQERFPLIEFTGSK